MRRAVEPDREVVRAARIEAARERPGSAMFGNRLRKNASRLATWARRNDVACYRVYDADMPEYSFAIDVYGNESERWVSVQEYAAPPTRCRGRGARPARRSAGRDSRRDGCATPNACCCGCAGASVAASSTRN